VTQRSIAQPAAARELWGLDPDVVFLNHGSFGACPRAVLSEQARWRTRLEAEPVRFFVREYGDALAHAKHVLAEFIGAAPQDLAFVANATAGVNTVLRSLPFSAGDELLTTDHAYGACRNALDYAAERAGASVRVVRLPCPIDSPDQVVEAIVRGLTPRTRLALVDHITSPSALVLPVASIVEALSQRGVDTLVDAAHAPGMVPLALDALGAAYTTGNCHKWLCAPKGAAFLHVRRDRQAQVRPLSISHGATQSVPGRTRFELEHDWTGTDDPTPWLSVPAAIAFGASLFEGGWPAVYARSHDGARAARDRVLAVMGGPALCPDEMLGAMAAMVVRADLAQPTRPARDDERRSPAGLDPLQERLWTRFGIEIPVMPMPSEPMSRLIRVSIAPYTTNAEVDALVNALSC
jgi:isopenicillin-N epimerase